MAASTSALATTSHRNTAVGRTRPTSVPRADVPPGAFAPGSMGSRFSRPGAILCRGTGCPPPGLFPTPGQFPADGSQFTPEGDALMYVALTGFDFPGVGPHRRQPYPKATRAGMPSERNITAIALANC